MDNRTGVRDFLVSRRARIGPGVKDIHHPVVGDLHLMFEAMDLTADPGLSIVVYTAEPNSPYREPVRRQRPAREQVQPNLEMSAEHTDGTDLK